MTPATYNAIMDAVRAERDGRRGSRFTPTPVSHNANTVRVLNDTGEDRERFDVCGIAAPVYGPAANAEEFRSRVTLRVVTPTEAHRSRFVILQEPIAAGRVGRAAISGMSIARVANGAAASRGAVTPGDPYAFAGGASGGVAVLWAQPIAGIVEAVVLIGGEASAPTAWARLTGYTPDHRKLRGRLIDVAGDPTGDEFTIYVSSLPQPQFEWDLRECRPAHGETLEVPNALAMVVQAPDVIDNTPGLVWWLAYPLWAVGCPQGQRDAPTFPPPSPEYVPGPPDPIGELSPLAVASPAMSPGLQRGGFVAGDIDVRPG